MKNKPQYAVKREVSLFDKVYSKQTKQAKFKLQARHFSSIKIK